MNWSGLRAPVPQALLPALASVVIVSLISLVGAAALVLGFMRKHVVMLLFVSFAAGTLLGDAFFHLLPEAVTFWGGFSPDLAAIVVLGFLMFFVLEAGLRWGHAHGEEAHAHEAPDAIAPFAWTNLVGDAAHNFIDGILVGAAYLVDFQLGLATTIAVAAHEIPQELGDFAILIRAGMRPRKALLYNLASALLAVLGALAVLYLPIGEESLEQFALPLIAGGFLYVAAADLVPELHHHTHSRYMPLILVGLVAGLAAMWGLLGLEVA